VRIAGQVFGVDAGDHISGVQTGGELFGVEARRGNPNWPPVAYQRFT